MCKIIVNQVRQFSGRINGYEVYESRTGEILGMTERDISKCLKTGEKVFGLAVKDDKIVLDSENFFQNNIMVKTSLSAMHSLDENCPANILYTVVEVKAGRGGAEPTYILINSRFGKSEVSAERLKALLEIGLVQGGAILTAEGNIQTAEGVKSHVAKTVKGEK